MKVTFNIGPPSVSERNAVVRACEMPQICDHSPGGRCCKNSCRLERYSLDRCVSAHEQSETCQLESQMRKTSEGGMPVVDNQWTPVGRERVRSRYTSSKSERSEINLLW